MAAAPGGEGADVNLTPLLDLVLQLIMFFMITVNFVRVDQFDDTIALPVAQSAVPIDSAAEEWIFLNLDSSGRVVGTLSTMTLDTPEKLKVYLQNERQNLERVSRLKGRTSEPKIVIILRADRNCRYQDTWQVLDSCQRAGYKHWQLRVMTQPG